MCGPVRPHKVVVDSRDLRFNQRTAIDTLSLLANNLHLFFLGQVQNMDSGTKLAGTDATGAKIPAKSTSPRPESNGRRPGPGFSAKNQENKV